MPKVPIYDTQPIAIRAAPTVLQQGVSPDSFGASLGESIQRTGGMIERDFIEPERQKANLAAINDAQAQAEAEAARLQLEHREAKGHDAVAKSDKYKGDLANAFTSIASKTLSNEAQRFQFNQWAKQRSVGFSSSIDSYAFDQQEKQYKADYIGAMQSFANRAVINRNDLYEVDAAYQDSVAATEAYLEKNNIHGDTRNAELAKLQGQFWGGVVQGHLIDKQYTKAQEVFQAHRPAMDADTVARLDEATQRGALVGGAMTWLDNQLKAKPELTYGEAFEESQKIKDPTLRLETESRIDRHYSMKARAEQEFQSNTYVKAFNIAEGNGLDYAHDSPQYQDLSPDLKRKLDSYFIRVEKQIPLSDNDSYAKALEYQNLLKTEAGKQKFASLTNEELKSTLNNRDFRDIVKIRDEGKKDPGVYDGIISQKDMINRAFTQFHPGVKPQDMDGTTRNDQYINWTKAVENKAKELATANKRTKPSDEDVTKAVEALTTSAVVTVPGRMPFGWSDAKKPYYTLTDDEKAKAIIRQADVEDVKYREMRAILIEDGIADPKQQHLERGLALLRAQDTKAYEQFIKENKSKK